MKVGQGVDVTSTNSLGTLCSWKVLSGERGTRNFVSRDSSARVSSASTDGR